MRRSISVIMLLLILAGCGQTDPNAAYPVRGQVLYEAKPPVGALVVLHPLIRPTSSDVPRPHGEVKNDGTFELTTFKPQDGAPPGDYAVTVEWWRSPAAWDRRAADEPAQNWLPARYAAAQT